jgi:predicted TIM-barrel fold metal-dependent hydrolase
MTGIVDIHTHLAAPGAVPSSEEMTGMIRLARRHGVVRAVALGNLISVGGSNPTPEEITTINDNTLAAMKSHPEFFIGFCYLNPEHPPEFLLGEIDRCVVKGGMRGLKFWVAVKATDRRHDPVMRRVKELNIPILYHAWYKAFEQGANESTPAEVADLAKRFPDVTIVMAHLTGDGERGVLDIVACPNVLIDTSGGQAEAGLVEYAVRRLGAERVIYGSDWPIRDFGTQVGRVLGASLKPEERALILRDNARRILKLGAS